jgi:sarcosine oxidase, subunit gamma
MTAPNLPIDLPALQINRHDFGAARTVRWRGDVKAVSGQLGFDLDLAPGTSRGVSPRLIWMSPSEVLMLRCPDAALGSTKGAVIVTNASDILVSWRISGALAADFLAKGCAFDFDHGDFGIDRSAQTRFAQVFVTVDRATSDSYDLYIERSYARYFETWLTDATIEFGA